MAEKPVNDCIVIGVPFAQCAFLDPSVMFKKLANVEIGSRGAGGYSEAVVLNEAVSGNPDASAPGECSLPVDREFNVPVCVIVEDGSADPLAIAVENSNSRKRRHKLASKPLTDPLSDCC